MHQPPFYSTSACLGGVFCVELDNIFHQPPKIIRCFPAISSGRLPNQKANVFFFPSWNKQRIIENSRTG